MASLYFGVGQHRLLKLRGCLAIMIGAARSIMLDGASIVQVSHHLIILLVMGMVFMTLGARLFKWSDS